MSQQPTATTTGGTTTGQPAKKDDTAQKAKELGDKAKAGAKAFGDKVAAFGKKAVDSTKKFVKETEEEIKMTESMSGLITMAINEFQNHVKQKADTTDKNKHSKDLADSFKDCHGIAFVASFNVAFTVGGSYGRGIVMKRLDNGKWSLPLAIQEIEGSVGWQLNVSRTKTFYVLKNDMQVKNLMQKQNVKLGGKGFAAIGNLGIQAQGDVTASKESLTTTTNDAQEVAATNASVGSAKGVALGVNVNAGTFQSCKKVNDATYGDFDIGTLFDKSWQDGEKGGNNNNNDGAAKDDEKAADAAAAANKKNVLKDEKILGQLEEFVKLMEGVIAMEKEMAKAEAEAKAQAAQAAKAQAQAQAQAKQNANANAAPAAK